MAFSRLQLAAALIEYDNDNPSAPSPRVASQSAIFAHARRGRATGTDAGTRQSSSGYGRGSEGEIREDNANRAQLVHPGGRGTKYLENDADAEPQVDLASWGLPPAQQASSPKAAISPVTNRKTIAERYTKSYVADPPRRQSAYGIVEDLGDSAQPHRASRTVSSHELDRDGQGDLTGRLPRPGSSLSMNGDSGGSILNRGRPQSPYEVEQASLERPQSLDRSSRIVSFDGGDLGAPGSAMLRSEMGQEEFLDDEHLTRRPLTPESRGSLNDVGGIMNRGRPKSPFEQDLAGQGAGMRDTQTERDQDSASGFAQRRKFPSLDLGDRRIRPETSYLASKTPLPLSPGPNSLSYPQSSSPVTADHDLPNPFAIPAPGGTRLSRFDPKAAQEARRMSQESSAMTTVANTRMNSRMSSGDWSRGDLVDQRQQRPFSTLSGEEGPGSHGDFAKHQDSYISAKISRPRTLIMPSPLYGVMNPLHSSPGNSSAERRGFTLGQKPLPPGALARPDSFIGSLPSSGNLTLSQKLFTSSLEVGGTRGDGFIGGAERDGEEGVHTVGGYDLPYDDDAEDDYGAAAALERPGQEEDWRPNTRNVTGPSLMDRIEARKQAMKGKQRVFTGDARPAMMARQSEATSTNKVDNRASWVPVVLPEIVDGEVRRTSKPLVTSESSDRLRLSPSGGRPELDKTKSVFGVDAVWNRELDKLRRAEEAEQLAEEEAKRMAALEPESGKKGKRRGKKAVHRAVSETPQIPEDLQEQQDAAQKDEYEEQPIPPAPPKQLHPQVDRDEWYASSEDEDGHRRSRPVAKARAVSAAVQKKGAGSDESSSEEDVPLSMAYNLPSRPSGRSVSAPLKQVHSESSSEEDEPLSRIKVSSFDDRDELSTTDGPSLGQAKASTSRLVHSTAVDDDEVDDDVPLAYRRAHMLGSQQKTAENSDPDEDDVPLGERHGQAGMAQQHRISMMQQQQQQQQQDFFRQSMFALGPPGSSPGYPMQGMNGIPGMMSSGMIPPMGMGMNPMQMGMPMPMPMMSPMPFGMHIPPFGAGFNPAQMGMPGLSPQHQMTMPLVDPSIDRWRREIDEKAAGEGTGTGTVTGSGSGSGGGGSGGGGSGRTSVVGA